MFDSLIPVIQAGVKGERIVGDILEIHQRDRWFTYPKFHETAAWARGRLADAGLKGAEVMEFPADGKTMFGTWKTGYAWDAAAATLTVVGGEWNGRVLADYREIPCSLAMWSAPTAEGGVEAEIVDVGEGTKDSDYAGKPVRGNIVLVNARAVLGKGLAAKHGAIGMVTDWVPQQDKNMDGVFWTNAFADTPMGWPLTEGTSRMFGFGMSRRSGLELREVMKKGPVRVKAVVKTRIYEGTFPIVTGMIAGTTGEEVLAIGHAFEQGAKDNASGVACIMEAVRVLAGLIEKGKLKRPRRGIRVIVTNECFGTIGYVDRFPECKETIVAGICLDETGIDRQTEPEVQSLVVNPQSNANYQDSLVGAIAEAMWKRPYFNPYVVRAYGSSDNMIAHPSIGIPAVWMGCHGSRITWHTTIDTPERMSPGQLEAAAAYTAVYLYFLANSGEKEAVWLAELAAAAGLADMRKEAVRASASAASKKGLGQRLAYLAMVHAKAAGGVVKLGKTRAVKIAVARQVKELRAEARKLAGKALPALESPHKTKMAAKATRTRPRMITSGHVTYDPIPIDEREGYEDPRWGGGVNAALGWADGKRTVAECVVLAEQEMRRALPGLAEELLWLMGKGVVGGVNAQRASRIMIDRSR